MRKILYLLTKTPEAIDEALLPPLGRQGEQATIVLLEEAVRLQGLGGHPVSVLEEDVKQRGLTSPFRMISYQDLLRLVFEADAVIAL